MAVKPNIFVFMVDDMRNDDWPALEKVTARLGPDNGKGAKYTRCTAPTPLCTPNRASFLTGQYTHNHMAIGNKEDFGGGWPAVRPLEPDMLPVWLQAGGYYTAMAGKYVNTYGGGANPPNWVPQGWNFWAALSGTFVNYTDFKVCVNGTVQDVNDGYSTTNIAKRAFNHVDAYLESPDIDEDTGDPKPIFAWVSFVACHTDGRNNRVTVDPKYAGTSTVGLPSGPAYNEADVSDKPPEHQLPKITTSEGEDIKRLRRERRESLKSVDDEVDRFLDMLVDHEALNDAVIFFMSDNGYMLGEHRIQAGKTNPYEESATVPLLVRGPGFQTGTLTRRTTTMDVTATICQIADVSPTGHELDGRSLLAPPLPEGTNRPVLIEKLNEAETSAHINFKAVRANGWLYVEYRDGFRELYDNTDQVTNRAGDPAYAAVEASLKDALDDLRDCAGGACDLLWTEPPA